MGILYQYVHKDCPNYDILGKPLIEVVKMNRNDGIVQELNSHEIIFVMKGRVSLESDNFTPYTIRKGRLLLVPMGTKLSCHSFSQTILVIFRMHDMNSLCDKFSLKNIYGSKTEPYSKPEDLRSKQFGSLEIHPRIWYSLIGIMDCIADKLCCRNWFEMKIKEFFMLLNAYYSKEMLYEFLYLMYNRDNAFIEYIHLNGSKYSSVAELASSVHMTSKSFSAYFVSVFGMLPSRWLRKEKARVVNREIVSTDKQFRQIAVEQGFSSDALFTRFCRAELGKTPTQIRKENKLKLNDQKRKLIAKDDKEEV